jgi:hypothetical protein
MSNNARNGANNFGINSLQDFEIPEDSFSKPVSDAEKNELFFKLLDQDRAVTLKFPDSGVYKLPIFGFLVDGKMACFKIDIVINKLRQFNRPLIGFQINKEWYFGNFLTETHGDFIYIDCSETLFHLSRRRKLRVEIPPFFTVKARINEVDGVKSFLDARLLDVSESGALLHYEYRIPEFEKNQLLKIFLRLDYHPSILATSIIRHSNLVLTQVSGYQKFGVEFVNLSPKDKRIIQAYIRKLSTKEKTKKSK